MAKKPDKHRPTTEAGKTFARSLSAIKGATTRRMKAESKSADIEAYRQDPFLVVVADRRPGFHYDFDDGPDLDAVILKIECQLKSEFDPDFDDVYSDGSRFLNASVDVVIFHAGKVVAILRRDSETFDVTRFDDDA